MKTIFFMNGTIARPAQSLSLSFVWTKSCVKVGGVAAALIFLP